MMGVFCGEGVVVPSRRRAFMLAELHFRHPRVLRMKHWQGCSLVVWFGWYGGSCVGELFEMSVRTTITNISTDATVE